MFTSDYSVGEKMPIVMKQFSVSCINSLATEIDRNLEMYFVYWGTELRKCHFCTWVKLVCLFLWSLANSRFCGLLGPPGGVSSHWAVGWSPSLIDHGVLIVCLEFPCFYQQWKIEMRHCVSPLVRWARMPLWGMRQLTHCSSILPQAPPPRVKLFLVRGWAWKHSMGCALFWSFASC